MVVWGGSGFIGRFLVGDLGEEHEVTAVGLPGGEGVPPRGVRAVGLDVLAGGDLTAVMAGADAVVYALAPNGRNGLAGPRMVEAATRVATAAAGVGIERWVHLSNVSVYPSGDGWTDDRTEPGPHYPLGESTLVMEAAVRRLLASTGARICFLRLAQVFDARPGLAGLPASYVEPGRNWQSFISLGDVATTVRAALAGVLPDVCVVADGSPLRAADAASLVARERGWPVHTVPPHRAVRFGPDRSGMLTSSLRIRPSVLHASGWRPSIRLSDRGRG